MSWIDIYVFYSGVRLSVKILFFGSIADLYFSGYLLVFVVLNMFPPVLKADGLINVLSAKRFST